jgi:LytS/YehU family sensor histidine kinase
VSSKLEIQDELTQRETKLKELSREAELAQLRQQLQPHFLFNSLNSIHSLIGSQPQKAREMILLLSDFLRGTIKKELPSWITLEEELTSLNRYLDIEKIRFGHRLKVGFSVEEEVKNFRIPPLLIQPLVENALKHGLNGALGEVSVELKGKKEGNYLVLEIQNPFDSDYVAISGAGFGLNSVERRLYLLFGRKDLIQKDILEGLFKVQLKIPQFS